MNPISELFTAHNVPILTRDKEPWMPKPKDPCLQLLRNHFPNDSYHHGLAIGSMVIYISDEQADAIEKQLKE